MQRTIIRWSLRLIGPLLFVLFLWRTDLHVLAAALTHVNWWPVAISLALMPLHRRLIFGWHHPWPKW